MIEAKVKGSKYSVDTCTAEVQLVSLLVYRNIIMDKVIPCMIQYSEAFTSFHMTRCFKMYMEFMNEQ